MSNEVKFYVVIDKTLENIETFEKMLSLISKREVVIIKNNDVFEVSGVDEDGFSKIAACIQPLKNDLKVDYLSVVATPTFNQAFLQFVEVNETKVYYMFDLIFNKIKSGRVNISEIKKMFMKVPTNIIETAKSYINNNQSIVRTAEVMFTHRNTINYRINKFIHLTGINIRDINNAMTVYLLLQLINIQKGVI